VSQSPAWPKWSDRASTLVQQPAHAQAVADSALDGAPKSAGIFPAASPIHRAVHHRSLGRQVQRREDRDGHPSLRDRGDDPAPAPAPATQRVHREDALQEFRPGVTTARAGGAPSGAGIRWRKRGAPSIGWKLVRLIQRLSVENVTWGAPRIRDEMGMLGHEVAQSSVEKYVVKRRDPEKGQRWSTFLANHMKVTAACDFFVVPTLTFTMLYAFVVLSHDRRRIVHVGVTAHPTAEWTARQVREAFPGDGTEPKYLLRDRDRIYGDTFREEIRAMELRELLSGHRCPWQNPFVERVIGSIRRECTDHVIVMGEQHLTQMLRDYAASYNSSRCHQSLDGNSPEPRTRETSPVDDVSAVPVLGGLHHEYRRAA